MTEDEMVRWHQRLDGHEFEQTLGDGEGQGSLACCLGSQRVRRHIATEQQQKVTTFKKEFIHLWSFLYPLFFCALKKYIVFDFI